MPHASVKLKPGVDVTETPALNEAGISESNLIRFIADRNGIGLVQKLGGWVKYYPSQMAAKVRALWAWSDTNANSHLAVGTELVSGQVYSNLSVITDGTLDPITPTFAEDNVTPAVSSTAGSTIFTITDTTITGIGVDDAVYIQTQISIGGVILFGLYQCITVDNTHYAIEAVDVLGNPVAATSTSTATTIPSFATTNATNLVTVTLANHGYVVGDTFPVLVATTIGGITFFGNYIVLSSGLTTNSFQIFAANNATSTSSATFSTGAIAAGTSILVVTGVTGTIEVGMTLGTITGGTFSSSTTVKIVNQISGTTGGAGSYTISQTNTGGSSASVTSASFSLNGGNARYLYSYGSGAPVTSTGYGAGNYGVGGYGTGVAITPSVGTAIGCNDWTLDNWGEELVACPVTYTPTENEASFQPIYIWSPTAGDQTAVVIPTAPPVNEGMFVAMPQRQIIAWGSTFTGIQDPLLIRWCDANNYNTWIAQFTNQAGSYRIPRGSKIVACIQGPQQGLIWTDLGVWSMQYIGQPYVYSFNEIGFGCGLIGHKAAATINDVVFWMSNSQFFTLASNGVKPVPCPVWDVIFQDLDLTQVDKIRAGVNSRFNEVIWYYPTRSSGGEVTAYVKLNVALLEWDYGILSRSAWIDQSVVGKPVGADPDTRYLYQHETSNNADGAPLLSSFTTGYYAMSEGDVKTFVDQVWPDMKWGEYGGAQSATVNITFNVTDYPGQQPTVYGPYPVTVNTTFISPRFRGRLVSIELSSNDLNSFWRIGNIRYRLQQDGKF
jgi:hypothetical protein